MRKIFLFTIVFVLGILLAGADIQAQEIPYGGRLVKIPGNTAVYYLDTDGFRHAFPNSNIYFSWFPDFSKVEVITPLQLSGFPLGKNIMYRPGSRLIKIPSVTEVYAVEPGGVLRNIPSEEAALELFGDKWASYIDDLNIAFFFDYTIGGVIDIVDGTPIFPVGTVVSFNGKNYLIDKRTDGILLLREITGYGWESNNLGQVQRHILSNNKIREFTEYGIPVVLPEARISCVSCNTSLMNKKDISQTTTYTSDNNKYSFDLPFTWIAESSSQDPVVLAVEAPELADEDGFAENLMINRWNAADYNHDVNSILLDFELGLPLAGFNVLYAGPSGYTLTGTEAVSVSEEGYVNWNHFELKGDTIYQFQFTGWLQDFGTYTDILHLMITSSSINQNIAD